MIDDTPICGRPQTHVGTFDTIAEADEAVREARNRLFLANFADRVAA